MPGAPPSTPRETVAGRLLVIFFFVCCSAPLLIGGYRQATAGSASANPARVGADPVAGHFDPGMSVPRKKAPQAAVIHRKEKPKRLSRFAKAINSIAAMTGRFLAGAQQIHATLESFATRCGEFRAAFGRSIAGREFVIGLHSELEILIFHRSPVPEVLLGKQQWLFYTAQGSMDGYRGINPFTPEQLDHLATQLNRRREALAAKGIAYLIVFPPDKHTVYPEYMPDEISRIGPSRLEQALGCLASHPEIPAIDLRTPFLEAGRHERIYYRTDTHWNESGAFLAYEAMGRELQRSFPSLRIAQRSDYTLVERQTARGDLARMLGISGWMHEREIHFSPLKQRARSEDGSAWGYSAGEIRSKALAFSSSPDGEIPRAVIFHDSFMEGLAPLLAQHFQRAIYSWRGAHDSALVEREHPNLVIEEIAERFIYVLCRNRAADAPEIGAKPEF